MSGAQALEPLYQIDVSCANCDYEYKTSRVRPSFKKAAGTDSDFYTHYKQTNPDYYVVRVCPFCGFSTTENFSDKPLTNEQRAEFELRVRSNWTFKEYGGERTWADALHTYKLGLLCAQIKGESDRLISGLLHHIAWLYREKGNVEQEKRFLGFALGSYVNVYENDSSGANNAKLMFLIGELNRRLGNYTEGVKWFSRIINDKRIVDSAMIRAAREQWAQTREDMLAAKLELPEEMQDQKP